MPGNPIYQKNPDMVTREIQGETILMPVYKSTEEMNCIYTLNPAATFVWQLLDGQRTILEIKNEVQKNFDGSEKEIEREFKSLISDLKEANAISIKD